MSQPMTKQIMREFVDGKMTDEEFKSALSAHLKMDVTTAPSKKFLKEVANNYFTGYAYVKVVNAVRQFCSK